MFSSETSSSDSSYHRRPSSASTSSDVLSPTETLNSPTAIASAFSRPRDACDGPNDKSEATGTDNSSSIASTSASTLKNSDSASSTSRKELLCILPSESVRYERGINIPEHDDLVVVEPLFTGYRHGPELKCWKPYVHPEGQLYFVSQGRVARFITEEYLYHEDVRGEVEEFMEVLEQMLRPYGDSDRWKDIDVTMEIQTYGWAYYMTDHKSRCVMWLERKDLTDLSAQCYGVESIAHMRFIIESEYYTHVDRFPHIQELPDGLLEELVGLLVHSSVDAITSNESSIAYTPSELQQCIALLKNLQKLHSKGKAKEYVISTAARLMAIYSVERFFGFYGVRGAKLSSTMNVRGHETKRTWLIKILSPILFAAPEVHLKSLEKMWIDKTIKAVPWKAFVGKLEREWAEFILYATVLLNANVAYLAIPVVIKNNDNTTTVISNTTTIVDPSSDQGDDDPLSPAAIANLLSILSSLGSIVVGLLLSRQHRTKARESALDAANYLSNRTHAVVGLETLAITYSLPYALLMWSMVTFIASVGITCFSVPGNLQPIIFTIAWFFVIALVLWTIITGWETNSQMTWRGMRIFRGFERLNFWKKEASENEDSGDGNAECDLHRTNTRQSFVNGGRSKWRKKLTLRMMRRKKQQTNNTNLITLPSPVPHIGTTSLQTSNRSHSDISSIHSNATRRRP